MEHSASPARAGSEILGVLPAHFDCCLFGQWFEAAAVLQFPELLQRRVIKAASGGNVFQPDEEECLHTLGAALHRGLCLKDSYNRLFDSPVSFQPLASPQIISSA